MGQLRIPSRGSVSEPVTEPDIVAVTLPPAIVVSITSAGNDTAVPTGETRVLYRAQADPRIVSAPVTCMPELTTFDPLPRLIVEGTVNARAVPIEYLAAEVRI
jgi:hypothetical protein